MWCIEVVCAVQCTMTNLERVMTKSHFVSHSIAVWRGDDVVEWVRVFDLGVYMLVDDEVSWRLAVMTHSVMLHFTQIASRSDTMAGPK